MEKLRKLADAVEGSSAAMDSFPLSAPVVAEPPQKTLESLTSQQPLAEAKLLLLQSKINEGEEDNKVPKMTLVEESCLRLLKERLLELTVQSSLLHQMIFAPPRTDLQLLHHTYQDIVRLLESSAVDELQLIQLAEECSELKKQLLEEQERCYQSRTQLLELLWVNSDELQVPRLSEQTAKLQVIQKLCKKVQRVNFVRQLKLMLASNCEGNYLKSNFLRNILLADNEPLAIRDLVP